MPKSYSPEERKNAIEKVITGLSAGTPLTVICREPGMPNDDTIRDWAAADPELSRDIARARETGFDAIAVEALEIIDAEPEMAMTDTGSRRDSGFVAWQKLRFEGRLKLLSKWDPKRYGDKTLLGSDPENPLPAAVNLDASKLSTEALREIMAAKGE